jgi:lysozyme
MTTGDKGISLIKRFEGFRAKRYLCPAGKPTIGYGHVILPGDPGWLQDADATLTEVQASALLLDDLPEREGVVNFHVIVPLNQNQFDALVDFVYNLGSGAFLWSTLLKRLNEGKYQEAAGQFGKWVYGGGKVLPGLVDRREAERELFLA